MNATNELQDRELVLTRVIDAPPAKVFRAWTDPELLKQWFAPKPWTTPVAELDVRPGGASLVVMRSPEGQDFPNRGVYLEVVPNRRLVFTDAYTRAWEPSAKPFMTVILDFEDEGAKTRYTARARHWNAADRETHEKMGFHEGWGKCTDQLAELVATLDMAAETAGAHPVVHFEMPYEARERMAKFYESAFGWKMEMLGEQMGNYVLATTADTDSTCRPAAGAINGGFYPKHPDWPAQYPSVVIAVGNIEEAMRKVAAAGGQVLGEPMQIPGVGRYVSFFDTERNRVSMLEAMPRDAQA